MFLSRGLYLSFALMIGAVLVPCEQLWAIVNIERIRPKSGETGISGRLDGRISSLTGNNDVFAANIQNGTVWVRESSENILILSQSYGESQRSKTVNEAFIHLRHIEHFKPGPWALEFFSQLQSNEFRRLKNRGLIGSGVRYSFIDREEAILRVGVGGFFSHEELDATPTSPLEIENTARANLYVTTTHGLVEKVSYTGTLYYQPRFDKVHDFHLLFDNQIQFQLLSQLSFLMEFSVSHDNTPPTGVKKSDIRFMSGLGFSY